MKHLNTMLLGGLILLLSACGGLPKPGAAPALYDFGIAPAFSESVVPVKLARVEALPGLESFDMRYRLAYQNPNQLYAYTQNRWGAAPADLLAQRLRHMGFSPAASQCDLRVILETFDQVFDTAASSRGVVSLRAELITGIGRQSKTLTTLITTEAPASSADAKGGVAALEIATDKAIEKLKMWVTQQECGKE
ncbi:MAG: PqiC family protein [Methylophilales bacterium]|nr:PqiC family protein [Methylophilales bacterium]